MRAETAAAIDAVRRAQRIADSRAGADDLRSKGGIDLVTAADVACEDAIRDALARTFPTHATIGEERGGHAAAGAPHWLVDPICGTRCYASNVPLYCTNIALVENGAVTAAVIGIGMTGEILYAERGAGARLLEHADDPPGRRIASNEESHVIWIGGRRARMAELARRMWLADRWHLWTFTSSVGYAYLAAGRIAAIVHYSAATDANPAVHTAAGCLVAEEAGAAVSDLDTGGPWTLATRSFLLAATPRLHAELTPLATVPA